jgi:hypothetical protein
MPAGATYNCIATTTLSVDTTQIDFSSISSAYTDLVLVLDNIQTTNAGSSYNAVRMRLNNDTTREFIFISLEGDGTTATAGRDWNDYMYVGFAPQASATTKGQLISHFMNYKSTTDYKTILHRANAAGFGTQMRVHGWRFTSAITTISILFDGTVKYKAGMTASLYGIAAA